MMILLIPYAIIAAIVFVAWLALSNANGYGLEGEDYLRCFLVGLLWLPILVAFIIMGAAIIFLPNRWIVKLEDVVTNLGKSTVRFLRRN